MESVLGVVVLIIIYAVVFVVKSLTSKDAGVEAKPIDGEAFPKFPALELPEMDEISEPEVKHKRSDRSPAKNHSAMQIIRERANTVTEQPVSSAGKGVRIKTRSEAKRAFIHSEIFNRKY